MSSIKINLDKEVNFVLTDENDKVMAIINVPLGTADIDNKLMTAISDDTGNSFEYFQTDYVIDLERISKTFQFEAFLEDEDQDRYLASFYLTKTEIY